MFRTTIAKNDLLFIPIPPIILTLLSIVSIALDDKLNQGLLCLHLMLLIYLIINYRILIQLNRELYYDRVEVEVLPANPTYNQINDHANNDV